MARRVCAMPTCAPGAVAGSGSVRSASPSRQERKPVPSGPRCRSAVAMARSATGSTPRAETMPPMPHTSAAARGQSLDDLGQALLLALPAQLAAGALRVGPQRGEALGVVEEAANGRGERCGIAGLDADAEAVAFGQGPDLCELGVQQRQPGADRAEEAIGQR